MNSIRKLILLLALGYPMSDTMGESIKLTTGVISSTSGFMDAPFMYQIDAAVQPGNSGGPMFDASGLVAGVVVAEHKEAQNANYAVKTSSLKTLIEMLPRKPALLTISALAGLSRPAQVKAAAEFVYLLKVEETGKEAAASASHQPRTPPPPPPPNDGIPMVFVQGGIFTMGCTPEQGNDCYDEEKPAHTVTVSDFYIGKYEVTQAEWVAVMGSNPSDFNGANLPVDNVSWDDVQEFINRLNALTRGKYRLPTEAEWEYAARGGAKTKFCSGGCKYAGSNNPDNVAWYVENNGYGTHIVGTKAPNELGLVDMSGNIWEWVSDWYGDYVGGAQTNPRGAQTGSLRVVRGGSWGDSVRNLRVSYRYWLGTGHRDDFLGFRLARSSK